MKIGNFIKELKHNSILLKIIDYKTNEIKFNDTLGTYIHSILRNKLDDKTILNIIPTKFKFIIFMIGDDMKIIFKDGEENE